MGSESFITDPYARFDETMQASEAEGKDKLAYFSQLYTLFQNSDDEDEGCKDERAISASSLGDVPGPMSIVSSSSEVTPPAPAKKTAIQSTEVSKLRHLESEPTATSQGVALVRVTPALSRTLRHDDNSNTPNFPASAGLTFVAETPLAQQIFQRRRISQRRALSDPVVSPSPSSLSTARSVSKLGKRKRKEPVIKLVSESRQIFKGLRFFYVQDDDINPVRRARITKAREHGVDWVREWSVATHIIVDEGLKIDDVFALLNISSIPSNIVMVNETYPIECLQFRDLLLAGQPRFQVKGHPEMMPKKVQIPASQSSDRSLQLKPVQSKPRKWDYAPPKGTPPRSESSLEKIPPTAASEPTSIASSPGVWLDTANIPEQPSNTGREVLHQEIQLARPDLANSVKAKGDDFETLVREMKTLKHLPLDDDDDNAQSLWQESSGESRMSSSEEESQSCRIEAGKKKNNNSSVLAGPRPENFGCMKGGTGDSSTSNPNARTIEILQEMADHYTRMNDMWRSIAYRKAITKLRAQPRKTMSAEEAFELPSIGKRLAAKIEEIVITDRLRRLENAHSEPSDRILQLFLDIYGVGLSQAWRWVQQGYKTLEDLKAKADLNANQQVGLEHYDDLLKRIPRAEIEALGAVVKRTARGIDDKVEVIIGGSYRRGSKDSGDIDFILTKPGTSSSNDLLPFLHALTESLTSIGFLVAALSIPRHESGSKWHGCCVLPQISQSIWRRIDFLLVPGTELGAALIYFTGNDIFNRSIRLWASKKGMVLNQRGLFKNIMRGPGRVKMNGGLLVEGADEKKIFKALGVKWRPPEQRIC